MSRGITAHSGYIQWIWLRIHTDEAAVGLGETYPSPVGSANGLPTRFAPARNSLP